MAIGRRCELGCETWPDEGKYQTCPSCGEPTKRLRNLTPIDKVDAEIALKAAIQQRRHQQESEARHREFDKFYAEHCKELGIPFDGILTVEDVARIPSHA